MGTWRCEACGSIYGTPPASCDDCGHGEFYHGSAVRLRRPGGADDGTESGDLTARDWWRYALLFVTVSTGLLVLVGLVL